MITLDQVRCFVAVAEELHFGRAAQRLQMTQPPLSRQIQKLERAVGAHLLERDNRHVELTGAGLAFLDEAYRLVSGVVFAELAHGGGRTGLDADPERPVELHAIWDRSSVSPVVRRVLDVVRDVSTGAGREHTRPSA